MEYDSRPSGSSVSPLIFIVAGLVALLIVAAVVYFVVLAPQASTTATPATNGNGVSQTADNPAALTGSGDTAGSGGSSPDNASPSTTTLSEAERADWRRGFRAFQQEHVAQNLYMPLASVGNDAPASFFRLFVGDIEPAPGLEGYEGDVSLYVTPSGKKVLRLHGEFDFTPTPGLTVSLSSKSAVRAIGDLRAPYAVAMEVGTLDQFSGETHFVLPDALPADALQSVVLWSKPYDILVATATLMPY